MPFLEAARLTPRLVELARSGRELETAMGPAEFGCFVGR